MREIGLEFPASDLAVPPIHPAEAEHAETALCPMHGSRFVELNVEGKVYFCPHSGGRMYWRAGKRGSGMYGRLQFPRNL